MKRVGFQYAVKVRLELSRDDIDFLFELAKSHYDATCRSVASPGSGSFLWGATVGLAAGNIVRVEEWSFRECDIARKILESARMLGEPRDSFALVMDGILRSAQEAINVEYARLIRRDSVQ